MENKQKKDLKLVKDLFNYYIMKLKRKGIISTREEEYIVKEYWYKRVCAFQYFIIIGYDGKEPIYYSLNTGLTNQLKDYEDDESVLLTELFNYVMEYGEYKILDRYHITELEDGFLAYDEYGGIVDRHKKIALIEEKLTRKRKQ